MAIISVTEALHDFLRLKTGVFQFDLNGRGSELPGLTYGVPYFRSVGANLPTAFDIMPNGVSGNYFAAWIDVCNSDLSGGSQNYQCLKLASNSSVNTVGSDAGGTGTNLPLNVCGSTIAFYDKAIPTAQYGQIDGAGLKMGNSSTGFWAWLFSSGMRVAAGWGVTFYPTSDIFGSGATQSDVGFSRVSAGMLQITGGQASANGSIQAQYVQTIATTVASLPNAIAGRQGHRGMVTDATQTLAAGLGATVVGGGANIVPVYCDGSAWKIG